MDNNGFSMISIYGLSLYMVVYCVFEWSLALVKWIAGIYTLPIRICVFRLTPEKSAFARDLEV
jgi:hypothetical protein